MYKYVFYSKVFFSYYVYQCIRLHCPELYISKLTIALQIPFIPIYSKQLV